MITVLLDRCPGCRRIDYEPVAGLVVLCSCGTRFRRAFKEVPEGQEIHQEAPKGWSAGRTLPCPACGRPAYSPGPDGLPQRCCHGCRHVWNPEAAERTAP